MILNMSGGGGGGGLNFRVIGGTSTPSYPKENDIWVNTDTEISAWAFLNDVPVLGEVPVTIATENGYLNASGALISSENYSVTDYTMLPENTTHILVRHSKGGSTGFCHEFSDANKNKISMVERAAGDVTYEVPANAVYVRLSVRISAGYEDPLSFIPYTDEYEGIVWISTGTSSPVEFNALKKNNITVYPISAKQYVGGAWVDKTAKSYQNGAWTELWNGVLYDAGNEYEYITGGWYGGNTTTNSTASAKSITKNSDHILIPNQQSASTGAITTNAIDLTNYSTLNALYKGGTVVLRVAPSIPTATSDFAATTNTSNTTSEIQTLTLDISGVEGKHQCTLNCKSTSSVYLYKMWLE